MRLLWPLVVTFRSVLVTAKGGEHFRINATASVWLQRAEILADALAGILPMMAGPAHFFRDAYTEGFCSHHRDRFGRASKSECDV